jgi:hypothetical protein
MTQPNFLREEWPEDHRGDPRYCKACGRVLSIREAGPFCDDCIAEEQELDRLEEELDANLATGWESDLLEAVT